MSPKRWQSYLHRAEANRGLGNQSAAEDDVAMVALLQTEPERFTVIDEVTSING